MEQRTVTRLEVKACSESITSNQDEETESDAGREAWIKLKKGVL